MADKENGNKKTPSVIYKTLIMIGKVSAISDQLRIYVPKDVKKIAANRLDSGDQACFEIWENGDWHISPLQSRKQAAED